MKTIKSDWLIILLILGPLMAVLLGWNEFPERFPVHFNFDGEPDRYGDKLSGLLVLPVTNIVLYFLLRVLPKIDPNGKNYELFETSFQMIRTVIHAFISFILVAIILYALGYHPDISLLIKNSILLLFLVMGNYLGTVRRNYFLGIRTPWTLASDEVWKKTHRLTGRLWVAGTIIMIIALPFSGSLEKIFFFGGLAVLVLIPVLYSYIIFIKERSAGTDGQSDH